MSAMDAERRAAIYSRPFLLVYDWYVLEFSCRMAWGCAPQVMLDMYNQNVSNRHLDVGVGTGYFLDRCSFPSARPVIGLVDLNANSLRSAAQRIARDRPAVYVANVLEPLMIGAERFDSIALNCLFHCLPGTLASKSAVFEHLLPLLNDGGVVFGSTVLGMGVRPNWLATALMRWYNASGMFCNSEDSLADLEAALKTRFGEYAVRVVGSMALFRGKR